MIPHPLCPYCGGQEVETDTISAAVADHPVAQTTVAAAVSVLSIGDHVLSSRDFYQLDAVAYQDFVPIGRVNIDDDDGRWVIGRCATTSRLVKALLSRPNPDHHIDLDRYHDIRQKQHRGVVLTQEDKDHLAACEGFWKGPWDALMERFKADAIAADKLPAILLLETP